MLEHDETALLLQLRSRHRAYTRGGDPAHTLDADTAELERRLDLIRYARGGGPRCAQKDDRP
ncbi:hypothetical protein NP284_21295 [Rhodopseudomonas pseudopalustris]|uniref:Uncharacterized protein n=1 Tax=Rhodopseudomonas pseudopalustris TaxID=1513892 RepID=A0A1H8WHI7_9BRAD|nr:hypothetical protein SAMN05444123_11299 [Rhodopseudomonas pseudopalustris]